MDLARLGISWGEAGLTVITAVGVYVAMIALSRIFGQRQFAVASTYDLAFVFAMGSLIGRVVLVRTSLATAVLGLLTMFSLHAATAWLHHHSRFVHRLVQNRPILLVANGRVLEENLRSSQTSRIELYEQLRRNGLGSFQEVTALVLERDGAMTLLPRSAHIDVEVLREVVGAEYLELSR